MTRQTTTETLGGRTDHRLALPEQEDEQGLRAVVRDERGHDPCGDEPPDAEEARPCLTLLAQLLAQGSVFGDVQTSDRIYGRCRLAASYVLATLLVCAYL